MKGEIYRATPDQAALFLDTELMPWVKLSRPLLLGFYGRECVCAFGTIPVSIMSGDAYLWLWNADDLPKIAFARHAIQVLPKLLELYPKLICSCFNDKSARWLHSLGARKTSETTFIFEKNNG